MTALCDELYPGHGTALAQAWRAKQLQYTLLRSLMGRYRDFRGVTEEALTQAVRGVGLQLPFTSRQRLMDAYLRLSPFPDVAAGLRALRQRGLRLAILSNGDPETLRATAANAGLLEHLDAVLSAHDVQVYKPSPAVYALASSRLGLDARAIGFVSSNAWDIAGAAAAGLTTFWVRRGPGDPGEELGFPPAHTVGSLLELPSLV